MSKKLGKIPHCRNCGTLVAAIAAMLVATIMTDATDRRSESCCSHSHRYCHDLAITTFTGCQTGLYRYHLYPH
jgi:hypothetical protein